MNGRRHSPVVPIDQVPPADESAYRPLILVVDDEVAIADTLTKILSCSGYAATAVYDAEEALRPRFLRPLKC